MSLPPPPSVAADRSTNKEKYTAVHWNGGVFFRFYVNSWGRAKREKEMNRAGAKAPARFLCMTKEDAFSEIVEVTHAVADTFKNLSFVVAAFDEAVGPRYIHRV